MNLGFCLNSTLSKVTLTQRLILIESYLLSKDLYTFWTIMPRVFLFLDFYYLTFDLTNLLGFPFAKIRLHSMEFLTIHPYHDLYLVVSMYVIIMGGVTIDVMTTALILY